MTAQDYPEEPEYMSDEPLVGEDGNAFAIIARVRRGLQKDGAPPEYVSFVHEEMTEGDYDHLLAVALRYSREP